MDDVSFVKWYLVYMMWFFEEFIFGFNVLGYCLLDVCYCYLFNLYYEIVGVWYLCLCCGMFICFMFDEVCVYWAYVDVVMQCLLVDGVMDDLVCLIMFGLYYEQQYQELLLIDLFYLFVQNLLCLVYVEMLLLCVYVVFV